MGGKRPSSAQKEEILKKIQQTDQFCNMDYLTKSIRSRMAKARKTAESDTLCLLHSSLLYFHLLTRLFCSVIPYYSKREDACSEDLI